MHILINFKAIVFGRQQLASLTEMDSLPRTRSCKNYRIASEYQTTVHYLRETQTHNFEANLFILHPFIHFGPKHSWLRGLGFFSRRHTDYFTIT